MNTVLNNFIDKYKPLQNYNRVGDDLYKFYTNSIEQNDFIKENAGNNNRWSVIMDENKKIYIINEFIRGVNVLYYYITEVPYNSEEKIEIILDEGLPVINSYDISIIQALILNSERNVSKSLEKFLDYWTKNKG